ncbi:NADH:flavin oxidoreductase/NADH oxidase family protein [Acinetobacter ursingii]|uniref:NADH:flavin oxidoreductase/NADH oxidase family protein n=1 Tax=Acinetobacter ursingii TaxID=108980 RepID=A0AA46NWK6_9GAMM|nr:NADH:flavin oxidoreductase/NADH oxidase family protein [Acinetobacter ursingii]MCU4483769.1 NADH:flavin oxidoreductase/NADH oxidase family protein [Acinetobacter ursingii]MCU4508081.1 NADH:flavin oxidoreductase/NADH oxidase family protein [Acinetobacter ursingii]MCU4571040.1 NADH:flavin oxidoreductase/NADH oxidase family protein [Acinetobacter ursingii]UYF70846.1 NADH:flavin oxidoreductase/NADH oxidase family protein [Acinetobacter ursingii]
MNNQTLELSIESKFKLSEKIILKNRLCKSSLSEQLADKQHNPSPELLKLYDTWSCGGAALLLSGNIMVDRRFLAETRNVVLDQQSDLTLFRELTTKATQHQTHFWAQLSHPGKQVSNVMSWQPVAPSAIAMSGGFQFAFNKPKALDEAEILHIIQLFAESAGLAKQVGYTGVEIHGAHGYLINQFLSPLHNQRTDQWGGSLENRMRFLSEVYQAIRTKVGPDFPIGVKLNSADFMKGGFDEQDSIQVIKKLEKLGVNLIEISGGTYESQAMSGIHVKASTQKRESYFIDFSEKIRESCSVPILLTGGFRSVKGMNDALQQHATDLIGLGRTLCVEPDLPNQFLSGHRQKIELPSLSTGWKLLDKLSLINITWYEHQLAHIGKGKKPDIHLNEKKSVYMTFKDMGLNLFVARR